MQITHSLIFLPEMLLSSQVLLGKWCISPILCASLTCSSSVSSSAVHDCPGLKWYKRGFGDSPYTQNKCDFFL